MKVSKEPGLGVSLDYVAVAELHDNFLAWSTRERNDTEEILKYIPDYVRQVPRW